MYHREVLPSYVCSKHFSLESMSAALISPYKNDSRNDSRPYIAGAALTLTGFRAVDLIEDKNLWTSERYHTHT